MTEPLGQSQVLPYLIGLANNGFGIEILSFEAGATEEALSATSNRLRSAGVRWTPLIRSESHRLEMKIWESSRGFAYGLARALQHRPKIVHARSYLPAAVADMIATVLPGAKMLFDCRGMLGDEYVDAGHWTENRLEYKLLKRFEKRAFKRTEGLVVLTDALRDWLVERDLLGRQTRVAVIPTCVDTDRFFPNEKRRAHVRAELGLTNELVVVYSGSLGNWYLASEMARFVGVLKRLHKRVALLILTPSVPDDFRADAIANGMGANEVIVRRVSPREMPTMLSAGDLGISFIQRCFSKLGSSPTKVAEYLASGLVAIVNDGVGDQAALGEDRDACVVLSSFDDAELERGAKAAIALATRPYQDRCRATVAVARARFSLAEAGVPRYAELYRTLCANE